MSNRKLWAEEIAHAMALRDCGVPWKSVGRELGVGHKHAEEAVRLARVTGFDHYPSRFGRTM